MFVLPPATLASRTVPAGDVTSDLDALRRWLELRPALALLAYGVVFVGLWLMVVKRSRWRRARRRDAAEATRPAPNGNGAPAADPRAAYWGALHRLAAELQAQAPPEGSAVEHLVRRLPPPGRNPTLDRDDLDRDGVLGLEAEATVASMLDDTVAGYAWKVAHSVDAVKFGHLHGAAWVGGDIDHVVFARDGRTVFVIETKYMQHRSGRSANKGHKRLWTLAEVVRRVAGHRDVHVVPLLVHTRPQHWRAAPRWGRWDIDGTGPSVGMVDVGAYHLAELLLLWLAMPERAGRLPTTWPLGLDAEQASAATA